ncbi:sulfate/molybdate ABC transporter ATP-binding protein [Cloacibacterium sp. TD35]|uniref:sulfate/molybdate ABC transporter ATP-binding protein n=1 Tax=Cloacibacterium sp. TD35 TaxID=2976818 RepID=UPI00237DB077|nr:ABC transporter ATP-binding protein [Cloacibacterium sp. TD35]WDT67027.1 ABC transporter ATP-binding protein [Cloacibacterium sp. TD35]
MLLNVRNLYFGYKPGTLLFRNINLSVVKGKIIALAGESGCGKSTLLNIIYGLFDWQSGEIYLEDERLFGPKGNIVPGELGMKLVSQNYDLMPYLTVAENIGKFISNTNLSEKKQKIQELLKVVGLEDYAHILPKNLSGGQQQRVAIARALSVMPKLLLLDEPFSNLDYSRKMELRERLFNYAKEHELSVMISTHEIQEILPWTDQIIVLQEGRLIQNDNAEETFRNPYNAYVAKLLGEVNTISEEEKSVLDISKNYFFPHQVKLTENGLDAQIVESRFAGNHYWNKILVHNIPLIMYSENRLEGNVKIKINI